MMSIFKNMFTKSYEDLSGTDFRQKIEASPNAVLLDVRTAGEVASGTIRGAKHLDFLSGDFARKVEQLDKSKEYFLFCRSGGRSGQACAMMTAKGFTAYNLAGGIGSWPRN